MVKLVGSCLILGGGGWLWWILQSQRRSQRETLRELSAFLRRMRDEIQLARTRLPDLMERLANACKTPDAARFFHAIAAAARAGESLELAWTQAADALPLPEQNKTALSAVAGYLKSKEDNLCNGINLVTNQLQRQLDEWDSRAAEESKRTSALCLSGAAFLVILLV